MRFCTSCGHELGVGRFCTNCGQPIDRSLSRTSPPIAAVPPPPPPLPPADDRVLTTDERRAARREAALTPGPARTPPTAGEAPPPPRFPLFADEVDADFTTQIDDGPEPAPGTFGTQDHLEAVQPPTDPEPRPGILDRFGPPRDPNEAPARSPEEALAALNAAADSHDDLHDELHDDEHRAPRRRWPIVLAVVAGLVLVVGLIVWFGTRGDDPAEDVARDPTAAADPDGTDVTGDATAKAPGNAPPSREADGDKATFVAANMLDGKPATAWRIAGDASGKRIVFTLPEKTTISGVGLINGYAKVARGAGGEKFDWYHGNRTIAKVSWTFDDKTVVEQDLLRDRKPQTVDVDNVSTRTITLRILAVSKPGEGRASRDFTAISDVELTGSPS